MSDDDDPVDNDNHTFFYSSALERTQIIIQINDPEREAFEGSSHASVRCGAVGYGTLGR